MKLIDILIESQTQPTMYVTIGISGSGKSTYINKHFDQKDIVSPDDMRYELTGNVSDQSQNRHIWANIVPEQLMSKLKTNGVVLLDATNLNVFNTNNLLNLIKADVPNLKLVALVWKPNSAISKSRIQADIDNKVNRSNTPHAIIDRQEQEFIKNEKDLVKMFDEVQYI
jgi:predicted kinase